MAAITPSTADRSGMSRASLYRAADAGDLTRIARGIYLPAKAPAADWNLIEAATRRPDATICLTSALAHHDLIDTIPDTLDVAIPRGSRSPATEQAITWHQFDAATFTMGRGSLAIDGSDLTIGLYSPERCIADAFRLRGQLDYEIARDALTEWLRRGGKPNQLMQVALQLPRAKAPVLRALEALS
ncbi:type IV toxin-antitoxin system AbiEi family antitoxin domain-containing protein [Brachybacterium nesterenkovii]|uniref:type IV toxin-antitoxin system AbiEi family antitoxin domain-containing protein n=1 Tax=Brachybacterium nesterenkovii TaxID=47847 RepID=UPI00321AE820